MTVALQVVVNRQANDADVLVRIFHSATFKGTTNVAVPSQT